MDAKQRQARARIAGLTAHAMGRTNVGPARDAAEARYAREVREEAAARGETISEAEVERRAAIKRRLFYARLAFWSSKARRARAERRRGYPLNREPAPVSDATGSGLEAGHRGTDRATG